MPDLVPGKLYRVADGNLLLLFKYPCDIWCGRDYVVKTIRGNSADALHDDEVFVVIAVEDCGRGALRLRILKNEQVFWALHYEWPDKKPGDIQPSDYSPELERVL